MPSATPSSTRSLPLASVEVWRCMRCGCAVETTSTDDISDAGMIRIGYNLNYCQRCAKAVGYNEKR